MKKILIGVMFATLAFGAGGYTGTQEGIQTYGKDGGYISGNYAVNTIKDALSAKDDTLVQLRGKITKQISRHKYEFSDGKDAIVIDINDHVWRGLIVGPNDLVEIRGEVDSKTFKQNQIDVKAIIRIDK